jgi:hypothetical protein
VKACTIVVTNKGRKMVRTHFRGAHFVTVLETEVKDSETGRVLNSVISHSYDGDTLTFDEFYYDTSAVSGTAPHLKNT